MSDLTFEQIVETELSRSSPKSNLQETLALINSISKDRIVRFNNSVFIFTNKGNKVASFSMCNADELDKMSDSLGQFGAFMKQCGYNKLLFKTKRKAMLRMGRKTPFIFKTEWSDEQNQFLGEVNLNV
jgi:hypothetical protein